MQKRYKYPLIAVGVAFGAAAIGFTGEAVVVANHDYKTVSGIKDMSQDTKECIGKAVPNSAVSAVMVRYAERASHVSSTAEDFFRARAKSFNTDANTQIQLCLIVDSVKALGELVKTLEKEIPAAEEKAPLVNAPALAPAGPR